MIKTRLIGLLSHARKYIVYQVLWQWLSLLCQVVTVYSVAGILEGLLFGTASWSTVRMDSVVILAAMALRFLCGRRASYASYAASVDVKRILREEIYQKLLRLGTGWRERVSAAEVTQLAGEGVEQLEVYFGKYLSQMIYSMLAPLTLFVILSFFCFPAAVVLLICVPLIPMSIVVVQKIAKKLLNKYWGVYTELGDSFLENLQGLTTLKIYRADERKAKEMDAETQRFRRITMKVLTMQLNSTSVMDIMAYGGAAVGIIVTLSRLLSGHLGFGAALMMILLASEFFLPVRMLGSFFHIAMNGMAASDRMFALLDMPEPEEKQGDIPAGPVEISLSEVGFSYDGKREILGSVAMDFPAGSLSAIVGESGCGKSTIAGLLMGRNTGYTGSVQVRAREEDAAVELSELRQSVRMRRFTLVTHESHLFKGTVEENLRIAKPEATEEELKEALRRVELLEFVERRQGLATALAENASDLSGGQRQRLALARALLHDSDVYIFDEATSNIDMESEETIMRVIYALAEEKTVILISHRLANVIEAGRIYLMEDGGVRESGTHGELLERQGAYYRLYEAQMALERYADSIAAERKEAAI